MIKGSNGINAEIIIAKIIKELMVLKDTSEVSSEQILVWARKMEAQKSQKTVLKTYKT